MKIPLRILHVDDNPIDVRLAQAFLAVAGIECDVGRVETAPALEDALQQGGFDLVLSDFVLPVFDGLHVLALVQRRVRACRSSLVGNDQRQGSQSGADLRCDGLCAEASPCGSASFDSANPRRWSCPRMSGCVRFKYGWAPSARRTV